MKTSHIAETPARNLPEILAPAGNMQSALAAFAAGADAVYLGLKHFSARMQAENFSITDLAKLTNLARKEKRKIYVALNTLLKPNDTGAALRLVRRLVLDAPPDALIVQDAGMLSLAREAQFTGELHLSTLANVTHQKALIAAKLAGANRVVLPRELSIDEVRLMSEACPDGLDLEIFVHGALCFCVSGRCWWSSYMGGKSGLRGRCVQPCRREYRQKGREGRFFSSLDLSLDVLVKSLLEFPQVRSWKIEGRKKGPHYTYHTVAAYKLLRDEPDVKETRTEAERLLELSFGRPKTRSLFLPQKNSGIVSKDSQTSSGMLSGRIEKNEEGRYIIKPRIALFAKDLLRIGYEDEPWHSTVPVQKNIKEKQTFVLSMPPQKHPKNGTPVFLIDRKIPEIQSLVSTWEKKLNAMKPILKSRDEDIMSLKPAKIIIKQKEKTRKLDILLRSSLPHGREAKNGIKPGAVQGLWLSPKALHDVSKTLFGRISWWLPPVIWPEEEEGWTRLIRSAVRSGARHFVCNEPWQTTFFDTKSQVILTAGPFCNIANLTALNVLKNMGFSSAIVSPELGEKGILTLPKKSPIPLGIVVGGYWPMGITRHKIQPLKAQEAFTSPKGETFWIKNYGRNAWIYPSWPLDLKDRIPALEKAGYTTFIYMEEYLPRTMPEPKRTSEFNWSIDVL